MICRTTDHAQDRALKRPNTPQLAYALTPDGNDCGITLTIGYPNDDESCIETRTTRLTFEAAEQLRNSLNELLAPIDSTKGDSPNPFA